MTDWDKVRIWYAETVSEDCETSIDAASSGCGASLGRLYAFLESLRGRPLAHLEALVERPLRFGVDAKHPGIAVSFAGPFEAGGQPVRRYTVQHERKLAVLLDVGASETTIVRFICL
ncbi:hypothetical protein [Breoghania sp. L-A4]|uniref:hypothetical protein n=1 Tax=Breoghania sp. L-A4 TaxID=2304600 RepID=UPI000E360029|nr:hypothetical protein [Breoghania sp. L-A4]AXS41155.1 hypothetical protein D1F64_15405 [Breoghania sp. L-A4]